MQERVNPGHVPIDLTSLRYLTCEPTEVSVVWQLRLPSIPWRFEGALGERASLLSKLEASFPYRAIWLSEWTIDKQQGWRNLAPDEGLSSIDVDLESGAWALFFFSGLPDSEKLLGVVPSEPANAKAALKLVRDLGATAALWSWYDNCEWMVVLPPAV